MTGTTALTIVLAWLAVLASGWLGWQLLRQNGRNLLRLDELEKRLDELEFGSADEPERLPVGTGAPVFELPDLAGERKSLAQFRGQALLLIFFNPDCGFCREMAPKLATLAPRAVPLPVERGEGGRSPGEGIPLPLILTTGDAEKNRQLFAEDKVSCPVLLQTDGEVAKAYQVRGTPMGYLISAEGKIASEPAIGAEALLKLASQPAQEPPLTPSGGELETSGGDGDGRANRFTQRSLSRSKIKRDGLKAGAPAPDFRLPRLDGRGDLTLSELRGKHVLLVFSSPECGPCNTLAPELEKFHHQHPELQVVLISKGEPKENRAKVKEHGLTFPVVLQQQWEISRRYAMFATPIAYLIDETGVIINDVAAGVEPILSLLASVRNVPSVNRRRQSAPQRPPKESDAFSPDGHLMDREELKGN